VSEKQFNVHKKLYKGYVDKANETSKLLETMKEKTGNATYSNYRAVKKGQTYALDGVILHELYFSNLGGKSKCCDRLTRLFDKFFGGYDNWLTDFKACAMSARGWAVLAYEQRSESPLNMLLDTHEDGIIMGAYPLLVLDMYEHAYFIDYANDKEAYFDKFMADINWDTVSERAAVLRDC
jgi:Fe-Mn family superoxide dismutase